VGEQPITDFRTNLLIPRLGQQKVAQLSCNDDGPYFIDNVVKQTALAAEKIK
jgi:hypothetical protein